jgi:molecular chaperone HtpG
VSGDDPIDVGEALETLVHQFADRWSFLRELIQNAIDAGSPEIEVRVDWEPPESGSPEPELGLMCVEVIDAGEGMDRQIIDTRLTRLFSSAKDGDYTKIGRFGIGFVSVFAIDPDLVCVDTGRAGEYWRVLFRQDRSFERIVLDLPTEGTTIRIYKRVVEAEAERARALARRSLDYWCKHAKVEIRFEDEVLSRPLELDARCVIEHQEEGTQLLIGYVGERAALRGYYHAGLTLHEEHDDRLPFVAFKIDSRYLEHTLTRDNVIRDDNYDKAMAIVASLAQGRLVEELVASLARAATEGREDAEVEFLRIRLLRVLLSEPKQLPDAVLEATIVPALSRSGEPEPLSLAEVRRQIKRCFVARATSPLTEALRARGDLVLCYPADSALDEIIEHHAKRRPSQVGLLCTATPASSIEHERWQPLRAALLELLRAQELEVGDIALGHLAYPQSPVTDRVAITQAKLGEITAVEDIGKLSSGWFSSKRLVVLNADHPTVHHLLELGEAEPELAAYLLLKLFFLRTELGPERDNSLASFAAEARWQRSTS